MRYNILTLFLLIAVSQVHVAVSAYAWRAAVHIWGKTGCDKDDWNTWDVTSPGNGSNGVCRHFSGGDGYGGKISGLKLVAGSCIKVYSNQNCEGSPYLVPTHNSWSHCSLGGSIWAIGYCTVSTVTKTCPSGSFVRKLYIPFAKGGITMHCFNPSSSSTDPPTAQINSAGATPSTTTNRDCTYPSGVRGVSLNYASTDQFFYGKEDSSELICGQGSSTSDLVCGPNQFLTGFTSDIEEITGVTKSIKAVCMDVKDPTLTCTPTELDSLVTISTCENTAGNSSKTCTISLKLGWGDPDSDRFSDTERNEKAFYTAYFGTVSTPKNLLSRFRIIGNSKIEGVKFNWGEHGTRSWSPLQTKNIIVSVPAGSLSTFQQLKGKCSFYGVHTSYVKRIDVTGSKRAETVYMSGLM